MNTRRAILLAAVMVGLYWLTGCTSRDESENGQAAGVFNGQPLAVRWSRDSHGTTTIDVPPALMSAMQGASAATPWGPLVAGGLSTVLAAYAAHQRAQASAAKLRAEEHKADAAEGWAEAMKP